MLSGKAGAEVASKLIRELNWRAAENRTVLHSHIQLSYMNEVAIKFLNAVKADPRIGPTHISLFMAILYCKEEQGMNPIYIFSAQLMQLAKISGPATYHKTIRQLKDYGYINYIPSYFHLLGSLIYVNLKYRNKGLID
jgi:hypothetical protein